MAFERREKAAALIAISDLVAKYRSQEKDVAAVSSAYTETEARGEFIDKFLEILGWDVHNSAGLSQARREVVLERTYQDEASTTGRPDYRLRFEGRDWLPVEAKRPSITIAQSPASARQARSYGWSLSLPASVLTNFSETVIYDTSITPELNDDAHVAVIPECRFHFEEYVSRFDELWRRLSFESLAGDGLRDVYGYEEAPRGTSPFDRTFLGQFRKWRLELAQDICEQNPSLSGMEIGRRTQRVLNALLFLRVCEDRKIGHYEGLLKSAEAEQVVEAFHEADAIFNAGLFDVLSTTVISAPRLASVIRELYWPKSQFAFGIFKPEVLAALYEQYLSERVQIAENGSIRIVAKPELAHAGGVVPTPEFIVTSLMAFGLENALTPNGVDADLTLLDPACGSGIFLVTALSQLIEADEDFKNRPSTLSERASLAKSHIFGIDIDGEAVEVAKLSILLTVLGEEFVDTQQDRSILPNLDGNLKVGNAIIGTDFDVVVPGAASIPERRAAVAPMGLKGAFPTIVSRGGFTVIVGNPPYVKIQVLSEHLPDQLSYFQDARSGLVSALSHNFDVYQLFVERALEILHPSGRLAFVIPHRFTTTLASAHIRSLLGPRLHKFVHFGELQLFPDRMTYPAFVLVAGSTTEAAVFERVSNLDDWRQGGRGTMGVLERAELGAAPWVLASSAHKPLFAKMEEAALFKLSEKVKIFVGVQTSADETFFITPIRRNEATVEFYDQDGIEREIELGLLRPCFKDRSLRQFGKDLPPDRMAIFPYTIHPPARGLKRGTKDLLSRANLQENYPLTLAYLDSQESRLRRRAVTPPLGDDFWAYGRSQSITELDKPKLIVRVLSRVPQYVIDTKSLVAPGGGDGGPYGFLRPNDDCPYDLEVLQAVLSHPAVDAFVASRGKAYNGSYVVHRKAFLEEIPVPSISIANQILIKDALVELHKNDLRAPSEQDSTIQRSLVSRRLSLLELVTKIVSSAFGLTEADMMNFMD